MHTAIYPFQGKNMHKLLQFRIPKGNKIIFLIIFFHLVCRSSVVTQGSETEKNLGWELLVQTLVRSQGHRLGYSGLLSSWVFKVFSDRDFTNVLGQPIPVFNWSQGAYFFHIARQHFFWASCACCLLCILVKRASPPLCLKCVVRHPLSLVFPRLNKHNSFSLSSYVKFSSSLINLVAS